MKACILLSGLQRNFKPFIENQLRCVIDKYKLDLFIYTSDEKSYAIQHPAIIPLIIKRQSHLTQITNFSETRIRH